MNDKISNEEKLKNGAKINIVEYKDNKFESYVVYADSMYSDHFVFKGKKFPYELEGTLLIITNELNTTKSFIKNLSVIIFSSKPHDLIKDSMCVEMISSHSVFKDISEQFVFNFNQYYYDQKYIEKHNEIKKIYRKMCDGDKISIADIGKLEVFGKNCVHCNRIADEIQNGKPICSICIQRQDN